MQEILEVQDKRHSALRVVEEPVQQQGLMAVVHQLAANPNVDIDKLQKILEMQERWEMNRDKSALRHAMAEFKKNPPQIVKSRIATVKMKDDKGEFKYSYADLEAVSSAIEGELANFGVTHAYITDDTAANGDIRVTCVLRYGLYEESGASLKGQPDTSGTKNAIQAKGSTVSYLEKYTLLAAVGMAAGMPDTDGNTAPKPMSEKDLKRLKDIAEAATFDDVNTLFREGYRAAEDAKDSKLMKVYIDAKEKRQDELKAALVKTWQESAADISTVDEFNTYVLPLMKQHGGDFKMWWAGEAKRRGWKGNKATGLYEEAAAQ